MNHASDLYQEFFHWASDPIFIINATTRTIVEANAQAVNDGGYRSDELNGLSIDRLFRQQDGSRVSFALDNRGNTCKCRCQLVKISGDPIAVNVSVTHVSWSSTTYLFIVARKRDPAPLDIDSTPDGDGSLPLELQEFPAIVGQSERIREVCRLIGSVAKTNATVLIDGESGTGKEIVANAIHAHSHRGRNAFVKVNCAALSETLLESELFGHVRGAFTGAIRDRRGRFKQADRGTIFLDEIGSMSLSGQAKLLRVLQEREYEPVGSSLTTTVDVRVLAATNADLAKAVTEGKFREDLYYRLNVFEIHIPPLRERKEDVLPLAQHFLQHSARTIGKEIGAFAPETVTLLIEHDWPGNVRELENAMEHAVIVEKGTTLSPSSLPRNLAKYHEGEDASKHSAEVGLREKLNLLEKHILLETLLRANGIKKQAALMLGIDPRNMPYLLRKHHLRDGLLVEHGS